ncbi:hypothetical protein VOLCADRAFT_93059 [Volvox carteri f. nagariensis]|uniref:Uncharacterized protein n=1 Tax=Volvox carteri f. nagariensis TaxID=3068 RepID=D8U186_VOLCA|nr:uncharacterized protein VOLCADRAFT_93059 [Volvox carteri f. nagariensis]EFJ46590.1 hypothetical protein VOLCADRAFT_93059 [Volvox carteri f. nagariensis]|eukprot:XP_002952447.1 hypothetical protein VOLCADRAFT_93059 [Volvox carteri f. nagariensis]
MSQRIREEPPARARNVAQLPQDIQDSNAIIMTVPQAKGLEFDDVIIVDFFNDCDANSEWRVLRVVTGGVGTGDGYQYDMQRRRCVSTAAGTGSSNWRRAPQSQPRRHAPALKKQWARAGKHARGSQTEQESGAASARGNRGDHVTILAVQALCCRKFGDGAFSGPGAAVAWLPFAVAVAVQLASTGVAAGGAAAMGAGDGGGTSASAATCSLAPASSVTHGAEGIDSDVSRRLQVHIHA